MQIIRQAPHLDRCVNRFSSSSWSILFSVWISMPSALATLIMSSPNDLRSSMKSISCPVNGLVSLGQEWLHCGHEHRSMRWWGQLAEARRSLARVSAIMYTISWHYHLCPLAYGECHPTECTHPVLEVVSVLCFITKKKCWVPFCCTVHHGNP